MQRLISKLVAVIIAIVIVLSINYLIGNVRAGIGCIDVPPTEKFCYLTFRQVPAGT